MTKLYKFFPILALVIPLAFYFYTLAPTYTGTDSAEFALCINFWGVCHPPGFGLYIALGHLLVNVLPLGSLIYKVNLLSGVYSAFTVLLVFLTLKKLKVGELSSFLISLALATTPIFWHYSVSSDVFSFGALLVTASLFFLFSDKRKSAFLFLGLSASHLYLTGLALPIYLWYFFGGKKNRRIASLVLPILMFFAGILPQFLIYLRAIAGTPINWGHVQNLSQFFDYLRRREFGSFFLIANEAARFSIVNFLEHWLFLLLALFGAYLPFLFILTYVFFFREFFKKRELILLVALFLSIGSIQLLSLSTISPTDEIFEFSKFYVVPIVIFTLICGLAFEFLQESLLLKKKYLGYLGLGVLIALNIYWGVFKNNLSGDYFSQNLIDDAFGSLPGGAIAITVGHSVNFGAWYEQEINGKYRDIDVVYFLNNNPEYKKYNPGLFERVRDEGFFERFKNSPGINSVHLAILDLVSRNLNREVFILQGSFEDRFFEYLKPNLKPYGLWWKVVKNPNEVVMGANNHLAKLKNQHVKKSELVVNQQKTDSQTYAVAYGSAGFEAVRAGDFKTARSFFERANFVTDEFGNINGVTALVDRVTELAQKQKELVANRDVKSLIELATTYYSLGYYKGSIDINSKIIEIEPENATILSNLGSSYALVGDKVNAKVYFEKALSINGDLELAKKGLESLKAGN